MGFLTDSQKLPWRKTGTWSSELLLAPLREALSARRARRAKERPAASPGLKDDDLVARISQGDREAFNELFSRHSSDVLGFLTRLVRQRAVAEEILQETFLQAWQQAASFRPEKSSARSWLMMLAKSRAIDRIRSKTARVRREESVALDRRIVYGQLAEPVGLANLEKEELLSSLSRALDALPASQRDCIELSFLQGLSQSQIAAKLGQPLGTVKSRILLGIRKMRPFFRR